MGLAVFARPRKVQGRYRVDAPAEVIAAAIDGLDVEAVETMLEDSPELANELTRRENEEGETMLCFAITRRSQEDFTRVSNEHVAIVQALINAGADLNRVRWPNDPKGRPGSTGMFPLGNAAWLGRLRLVEQLIAAGASIDAEPEPSDTALSVAADHRHTAVVQRLIQAGASYSARPLVQVGSSVACGSCSTWTPTP